jgi:MFS family permease
MPIPFKIQRRFFATAWKRTLYIMFFAQMISMIGFSSVFPFLPLYVKSLGTVTSMSTDFCVGLVFSGQAFSMMIASPIWGAVADRWGRKLMVERAMLGGAVVLALMAFVRSAEELVMLRMAQGLISGVMGATNALVAATAPRGKTGYAMGLMQVAMGLGLGLGPLIGGMVADAYGYRAAFYITAALLAIAGVVVFFGVDEQFVARESSQKSHFNVFGAWQSVLSSQGVPLIYALRFINQMGRIIFIPILPLFIMSLIDNPGTGEQFHRLGDWRLFRGHGLFLHYPWPCRRPLRPSPHRHHQYALLISPVYAAMPCGFRMAIAGAADALWGCFGGHRHWHQRIAGGSHPAGRRGHGLWTGQLDHLRRSHDRPHAGRRYFGIFRNSDGIRNGCAALPGRRSAGCPVPAQAPRQSEPLKGIFHSALTNPDNSGRVRPATGSTEIFTCTHTSENRLPMAQPWQTIERISTEAGPLELRQRGRHDFLITVDGRVLMNSMAHRSEVALGQLACGNITNATHPRVLVGGLGMGYTLKAVLDSLPATGKVVVAELNPTVLKWCRGPLAGLSANATADTRVTVDVCDVAHMIRRYATGDTGKKFDAIILDLYTGPYVRSHRHDDPLYGSIAINRTRGALTPGGVFAVWGENYDAGFAKRLTDGGFATTIHRAGKGGPRHVVYLGRRAPGRS